MALAGALSCQGVINGGGSGRDGGPADGGEDGCESVTCAPGQRCVDGACISDDCCDDIICENEGEVCRGCTCVAGAADIDDDGYPARVDCDDHDSDVIPGSTRPCSSDCGAPGTEICRDGSWVECNAPARCDCSPGEIREVDCGLCGAATQVCQGDGLWGPAGACLGEGECLTGTAQEQGCGLCGVQQRTCSPTCRWPEWGACLREGECEEGTTERQDCGRCGEQERTCGRRCMWGSWSACAGEGPCAGGESESRWCGRCGTQSRVCTDTCAWLDWASCLERRTPGTGWARVSDPGDRRLECPGQVLSVQARDADADGAVDDMALDCCDAIPGLGSPCAWTEWAPAAWFGQHSAVCPEGHAVTALETNEWNSDRIVDSFHVNCCPSPASGSMCAWQGWVPVNLVRTGLASCPAGSVVTGLETSEDHEDWIVDRMRVRCCSP